MAVNRFYRTLTETVKIRWIRMFVVSHIINHYCDDMMGNVASQITSLTIVYTTVYSDADQSKHQSSETVAFVWGNHRGPVNSLQKWPVTRKMFPFDDVIIYVTANCTVVKTIPQNCNFDNIYVSPLQKLLLKWRIHSQPPYWFRDHELISAQLWFLVSVTSPPRVILAIRSDLFASFVITVPTAIIALSRW